MGHGDPSNVIAALGLLGRFWVYASPCLVFFLSRRNENQTPSSGTYHVDVALIFYMMDWQLAGTAYENPHVPVISTYLAVKKTGTIGRILLQKPTEEFRSIVVLFSCACARFSPFGCH